jgi:hypothetical protein
MEQISSKKSKKTRRKLITNLINFKLIDLDTPLLKYYKNTLACSEVLVQKLDKITSRYCNSRTCLTCNGIRTAKYINYYGEQIKAFNNPYFVTLTAPTIWCINPETLRYEIERRESAWRKITKNAHSRGVILNGVKSLEVVASETKKDYFHPHFHLIIDGKEESEWVLNQWLKHFPGATKKAQMVKPVFSQNAILEVFKYGTKFVLGKKMIEPESLDRIIQSLYRKRLISTFGTVKRFKDDDVNEIVKSVSYDDLEVVFERYWVWFKDINWIASDTGELFSDYKINDKDKAIYN